MKTKTGDLKLSDLSENMKNILTVLLDGKTRSTNQLADVVLQLDRVQESLVAVLDHYQPPPTTFEFIAWSLTED